MSTSSAPSPNGHYSQAVVTGDMVYLSNQLPTAPTTNAIPQGIAAQTRQVIANCQAILHVAGSDLTCVVSVSIQVTDMDNWALVDAALAAAFGEHRPARGVVEVSRLHKDALIAMQMIAGRRRPWPRIVTIR
ncbi:Rid family hydrolase [Caulobacter sp. 1776]|uniref:RidA family protein n=1 Tax=Caulobacter sp. 1776 TaxID=3156420 RepID=UPI00339B9360